MQPRLHVQFRPAGDGPLRPERTLNGHTKKTSAEGKNTIGCMYNLDLLMMGLCGLKHVEERR